MSASRAPSGESLPAVNLARTTPGANPGGWGWSQGDLSEKMWSDGRWTDRLDGKNSDLGMVGEDDRLDGEK